MQANLTDRIVDHFHLTAIQKSAIKKLNIETLQDLLYHFPSRYGDTAEAKNVNTLQRGDNVVIYGKITNLELGMSFRGRIPMAEADIEDETGKIHCTWFNQPYIAKMYTEGSLVRVEGKISQRKNKENIIDTKYLYFSNPRIEKVAKLPTGVGDSLFGNDNEIHSLYPVYPESRGITSLWLYHAIQKILKSGILETITETIPAHILEKYHLPGAKTAFIWIHAPQKRDDAISARKRFSFEEIFTIQLGKQQNRKDYENKPTFTIEINEKYVQEFIRRFPFKATNAQLSAINTILTDMGRGQAMSRLLEGDVGSGKTAVAAVASYATLSSKLPSTSPSPQSLAPSPQPLAPSPQIAYMCPTEILAQQHFESFIQYFSYLGIQVGLLTSSGCRKFPSKVNPKGWTDISRSQLLKWISNGEINIVIGTHALIQKSVHFRNLALVIIDEQHRFGTDQRAGLLKKEGITPHLLSMTATPIPRTLALTLYGDLDITLIDQLPEGRKPIVTEIVTPNNRDAVYEKVRLILQAGRQVYVICPRIDEPDPEKELALNAKSVKKEAERLKAKIFPEYNIGIIHSRMKAKDKDMTMQRFKRKEIDILCATSVIEVGVNVPNATVIIIEGAERFGLAQLHQLRGRVMRSTEQAYCYAFTETTSAKSIERLRALQNAKNGFELAELDLAQRGPGELSGLRQWGVSDVAMEALKNLRMVEAAREEAKKLIEEDINLANYPLLKQEVEARKKQLHFE